MSSSLAESDANLPRVQVLICGAGPVGLFTGVILASQGVQVIVLEALPQISDSPRALGYQPPVLAEFIEANIYDDVRAVANETTGFTFWAGDGPHKERIATSPKVDDVRGTVIALNCSQPTLAKVFLANLETYQNARVFFDAQVIEIHDKSPEGPMHVTYQTASGQKRQVECDWLIGADGARSTVRKLSNIEFEGFTWPKEGFVSMNVKYPFSDFGFSSGNFFLHPVRWAVVASIDQPQKLWRVVYGTRPGMTVDEIENEIPKRLEDILPDPDIKYDLIQVNPYKVHQRCAAQFRKGRVILAGDAAHSNNPMGGLGLMCGLLDAGPLGRALTAVIHGRAPETLLDKWATLRRQLFLEFVNPQSIEWKRLVQQGGYGDDPAQIWAHDETAKSLGMIKWLQNATPEAQESDEAMFKAMSDKKNTIHGTAVWSGVWSAVMPLNWMAEYEDPEVLEARRANRPPFN